ncbi:MAG: helix-turn-helix domain-containing protein [bacterium]|nr:helix-turn-helix domain-containing protein [bacterium]
MLDADEVAVLLRVHVSTIRAMAASGAIPAIRCGRLLRFSRIALERWLSSEAPR